MANLRIVATNAADSATIVASSTTGTLAAANMQVDERSKVWRSAAYTPSATLTLTWSAARAIDSVGLFFTNLSPLATVRVRAYRKTTDVGTLHDASYQPDPPEPIDGFGWGADPIGRSGAVRQGAPQHEQIWLDTGVSAAKLVLDIADPESTDGYIEVSRLCVGARREAAVNMGYGMAVQWADESKPQRAESGDLRTEAMPARRRVSINLGWIRSVADRNYLLALAARGLGQPLWLSGWPVDASDAALAQMYTLLGAFVSQPEFTLPYLDTWGAQLTFEEMA